MKGVRTPAIRKNQISIYIKSEDTYDISIKKESDIFIKKSLIWLNKNMKIRKNTLYDLDLFINEIYSTIFINLIFFWFFLIIILHFHQINQT
jgi:hypothetical protein